MRHEGFVDGGLLEAGNKLAVRQIAAIALESLRVLLPTDNAQHAALSQIADGLEAICNEAEPGKAFRGMSSGTAASALAGIATTARGHDDALDWLRDVLSALAEGAPANDAFGWTGKKHRPGGNLTLRNWLIQTEVHEEMRSDARPSWRAACATVADRVRLSVKSVELIAKGVTAEAVPDMPEDIFPAADLDRLRRAGVLRRLN